MTRETDNRNGEADGDSDTHQETESAPALLTFAPKTLDFGVSRAYRPTHSARAVKLRLVAMMGLLLVVIFAMKEAGKPERWKWLGFDHVNRLGKINTNALVIQDLADSEVSDNTDQSALASSSVKSARDAAGSGDQENSSLTDAIEGPDTHSVSLNTLANANADSFWLQTTPRLAPDHQQALFLLLRKVARAKLSRTSSVAELEARNLLIGVLEARQSDFQSQQLNTVSVMREGAKKKRRLQSLFAFDDQWKKTTLPTLRAAAVDDDFTFAGQLHLKQVLILLSPHFLDSIEDLSGMGTRRDLAGWLAVWDAALDTDQTNVAQNVSLIQLSGQAAVYRGKSIALKGRAKTYRLKQLDANETRLSIKQWYEVWIDPNDPGEELCCVYAAKVPSQFTRGDEHSDDRFHSIDVPVSLSGVFFKVRSYRDSGGGVSHAPVVVTGSIDASQGAFASAGHAVPTGLSPLILLTVVGLASTVVAVVVYRGARTRVRPVTGNTARHMHRALETLANQQDIKTNLERVAELDDQDLAAARDEE